MANLQALRVELDTDELTRGYAAMSDSEAATDLNILYRPASAPAHDTLAYMILETHRENTGTDTNLTTLWGRVCALAQASVGDDVFGATPPVPATARQIGAAQTMKRILDTDVQETNLIFDSRYEATLDTLTTANVYAASDKDALWAMSGSLQSRANELALGNVRTGTVSQARAL